MQDIKARLRTYIADNFLMGGNAATFTDGDSFMAKHVIDSTGFLELVTYLEETWKFAVEDEEMVPENLDSLNAIDAYVRRKIAA
jgi:acyl carrier protein